MQLYDYIFRRKSIRKYLPETLPEKQLTEIMDFVQSMKPLHPEIAVKMELARESDIKGMVSAKAPHYLLLYSEKKEGYLQNAGFLLQQADLYLSSLGLGSCWLGMAKASLPAKDGLHYIIMLAFGKPQGRPHRENVSEFKRKTLQEISAGSDDRLEAARLAPSATNSQPWFFSCDGGDIHVYRKKLGVLKAALYETMNQIDMGIVLCHIWLASEALNRPFAFSASPQGAPDISGYACIGKIGGRG